MVDHERISRNTFVSEVVWLDEVESTNSWLLEQAPAADSGPILVGATRQTRGRGRGSNSWWAGDGALTFSLLIEPDRFRIPQRQWPLLSLTVGLAICSVAETQLPGVDVRLKWPNDVYADGRKLSGVLIESHPVITSRLVIGIGLNLNNLLNSAPETLRATAVSLRDLLGQPCDPETILISLLNSIERHLTELGAADETLPARWRNRCFLTGRVVTVVDALRETSGTCLGIDDDGALRLLTPWGEQRLYGGVIRLD